MISPVEKPIVTSPYGYRILNGQKQWHPGIDYVSGSGNKMVRAVCAGKVILDFDGYDDSKRWTDMASSAGNYVCVQHLLTDGSIFFARYLHIGKNLVSNGQQLKEGDHIGEYANVGISYGAHLHFETFDAKWQANDCGLYLAPAGIPIHA